MTLAERFDAAFGDLMREFDYPSRIISMRMQMYHYVFAHLVYALAFHLG